MSHSGYYTSQPLVLRALNWCIMYRNGMHTVWWTKYKDKSFAGKQCPTWYLIQIHIHYKIFLTIKRIQTPVSPFYQAMSCSVMRLHKVEQKKQKYKIKHVVQAKLLSCKWWAWWICYLDLLLFPEWKNKPRGQISQKRMNGKYSLKLNFQMSSAHPSNFKAALGCISECQVMLVKQWRELNRCGPV